MEDGYVIKVDELMQTSPYNIPGPTNWKGADVVERFIEKKRKKWGVDSQEILIGVNDLPPSDPNCLVYIAIGGGCYEEFFRKDLKPGRRWINKSYMHRVPSRDKRGAFDYTNNIAYV